MLYFPNITDNWNMIAHTPISAIDESYKFSSMQGRAICLVHAIATPLKAVSGYGRLILTTVDVVKIIFAIITLNTSPKNVILAGALALDVLGGVVLIKVALLANLIKGIAGAILHPGAMIHDDRPFMYAQDFDLWGAQHNMLRGTLVNY